MKNSIVYIFSVICLIIGCQRNQGDDKEIYHKNRTHIINVQDRIVDIDIDLYFKSAFLYVFEGYLILKEIGPIGEKGIHLFDSKTYEYITSTALLGRGPGEVTSPGRIGFDINQKVLWVPDFGKKVMWKFYLDSILSNDMYLPSVNMPLFDDLFIERFGLLNDSVAIGKAVRVLSDNSFEMVTAKFNINTNSTKEFGYENPRAIGRLSNSLFKMSLEDSIYVNCYAYLDLMTICNLDGSLIKNIYGPNFKVDKHIKNSYFFGVDFINDYIIASYIGDIGLVTDNFGRTKGALPSQFLVFDLDGNYKFTIEMGEEFSYFCTDQENGRVIVCFNGRENPLAYFDFDFD